MIEKLESEPLIKKHDTTTEPNIKGDKCNIFLIFVLYTLEGVPLGLLYAIQLILQNKQNTSFKDQAIFSLSFWPFSVKLLWAPLVDSLYIRRFGRRKSWLIPVQYTIGIFFFVTSFFINDWLINTNKPNVMALTAMFFIIIVLIATQDIVVDGWALTLFQSKNIGYTAVCNTAGQALGVFLGFIFLMVLTSETFWNHWRSSPQPGGIVSLQGYLYFWGVIFMVVPTLIALFKTEKNYITGTGVAVHTNVVKTYKLLFKIMKLPSIKTFSVILVTFDIAFASVTSAFKLKLIDGGITNDQIAVIELLYFPLELCSPFFINIFMDKERPLKNVFNAVPYRLLIGVLFAIVIYFTPTFLTKTGPSLIAYEICLVLVYFLKQVTESLTMQLQLAFFAKISDPKIGSTNMALLSTITNIGIALSNTAALWLIDILTFKNCSSDYVNTCSSENDQKLCSYLGGTCRIKIDGFYVETVVCTIFGVVWCCLFRKTVYNLQSKNVNEWYVQENKTKE